MVVCRMPFLPNATTCGHRLNSRRLLGCGRALNDGVSMVEEVQVGEMIYRSRTLHLNEDAVDYKVRQTKTLQTIL
eukprot:scaffold23394_cov42-Cyclotella_meneghiniana.AAC.4